MSPAHHYRALQVAASNVEVGQGPLLFGGSVMMASPLMAVLMLRDLGLEPWQYGLALGLPWQGARTSAGAVPAPAAEAASEAHRA